MTIAVLAPVWNGTQFFDNQGLPLAGGKIGTFVAGGFTAQAQTYPTSNLGGPANANPITLDSSGRLPVDIWIVEGALYNFVLYAPNGTTVLEAVDYVGIRDPLPDQTLQAGKYLKTDGIEAYWDNVSGEIPSTEDIAVGSVLAITAPNVYEWDNPAVAGQTETFAVSLASYDVGTMDRNMFHDWHIATVVLESNDAHWDDYSQVLSLDTPGMWRVTVRGYAAPAEGSWPNNATSYGTALDTSEAFYPFNQSQYFRGNANSAPNNSWSILSSASQPMSWYDEFYVDSTYYTPLSFYVSLFAEMYGGGFAEFKAFVTATKLSGTIPDAY